MIVNRRKLRKIDDEVWRDVPKSYGVYQVSNYGRVKSFSIYKTEGRILKGDIINGFILIRLKIENIKRAFYLHKLVAEVWLPRPSDKHTYVTHLDGKLKNNRVANLEWHTKESLTEKHRELSRLRDPNNKRKKIINNSKLLDTDVMLLKSMLKRGVPQVKIAKMFCISEMQVTRIKRGENWGHIETPD